MGSARKRAEAQNSDVLAGLGITTNVEDSHDSGVSDSSSFDTPVIDCPVVDCGGF